MNINELKQEVEKIEWWHKIDLGNGIITPGKVNTFEKLKRIGLPDDLTGKSVLDIGAWDGFYSFEAERRGASRVVAIDWVAWNTSGWPSKKGFELAKKNAKFQS